MLRKYNAQVLCQHHHRSLATLFTFPDLSEDEKSFIEAQTDLVLKPKHTFVPVSRKYLPQVIGVVQKQFPKFKIPKREADKFVRNLTSITKLERTLSALNGVDKDELDKMPEIILKNPAEIARWRNLAKLAEIELTQVPSQLFKHSLHGLFAIKYINDVASTLELLDSGQLAHQVRSINFAKYSPLTLANVEWLMQRHYLGALDSQMKEKIMLIQDDSIFTKDLARIVFLWRAIFKAEFDGKAFDIRSFKALDPLEAVITLTALTKALDLSLDSIDPQKVWNALIRSSVTYPVGFQIQMLQDIGFSLEETRDLMLPLNSIRLSSKSLPMTSANYVSLMHENLCLLRQENPSMSAQEFMKSLVDTKFGDLHNKVATN